jgi:hypothetical protein
VRQRGERDRAWDREIEIDEGWKRESQERKRDRDRRGLEKRESRARGEDREREEIRRRGRIEGEENDDAIPVVWWVVQVSGSYVPEREP